MEILKRIRNGRENAAYLRACRRKALRQIRAGRRLIPILQTLWLELYDRGYKAAYRRIAREIQVEHVLRKLAQGLPPQMPGRTINLADLLDDDD